MSIPNWKDSFRDLPKIPSLKKWIPGDKMTKEQKISFRLLNGEKITEDEEVAFTQLANFYDELGDKLKTLNYATFSESEFEDFKNYIFYAFNYMIFASNGVTVHTTYRLVVNESVLKKNETIVSSKYLTYPPLDVVKTINKYNRANTPQTTLFYTCQNIDTSLKEIRPPIGKLITVGVWSPTGRKKFTAYAISHSSAADKFNEGLAKATKAFEETKPYNHELFFKFSRNYLQMLGYEFTKHVNHHYEYVISALFAEKSLKNNPGPDPNFKFDCIIYPSVGNDYKTDNIAFLPEVIDNEFKLIRAIEFEVEEQLYDQSYDLGHLEKITLARVKNLRVSKSISDSGEIVWD